MVINPIKCITHYISEFFSTAFLNTVSINKVINGLENNCIFLYNSNLFIKEDCVPLHLAEEEMLFDSVSSKKM